MQDTPEDVMREDVMRDEAANWPSYSQQAQPTAQPQAGNEGDPALSREIPGIETGEQRWAGDEGYLEEPGATTSSEAYGQGETSQFTALGAEPGIAQQDVPPSQQSRVEEQRSEQGILGAVGDMFRGLFGNAPRTPRDDEGEGAGEAHP